MIHSTSSAEKVVVHLPDELVRDVIEIAGISTPIRSIDGADDSIERLKGDLEYDLTRFWFSDADKNLSEDPWAELADLAATARKLEQKLQSLSCCAQGLLTGLLHGVHRSAQARNAYFSELLRANQSMGKFDETCARRAKAVETKGGAPTKEDFQDTEGPFYIFARNLILRIGSRGGRTTLDKNRASGSLIEMLKILKPFMPSTGIPAFLSDLNSAKGLTRLQCVKTDAGAQLKALPKFLANDRRRMTNSGTGQKPELK